MHRASIRAGVALFLLVPLAGPLKSQAPSQETIDFFQVNCTSCHTIGGGRLTGPDLKDVTQRRDRDWLVRFLLDPKAVIDSGDPYAQALFADARGVYMPTLPSMTKDRAASLLDLIETESALEKSQFAGLQISDRPLTAADVDRGRALFLGRQRLKGGGPACISCHTTREIGGLGGGALGPDLTAAYARLEGRKALSAWLSAPPSLVMQPVFARRPLDGEEVLALVAYLKSTAESEVAAARPRSLEVLLSGVGVAALVLVAFDSLWRRRFRAVRRPLVEGNGR